MTLPLPPMNQVTIYSKPGCHLCEDVEAMVREVRRRRVFALAVRNILEDPAEVERYQYAIPVIVLNGREIARYRLSEGAFEAALEQEDVRQAGRRLPPAATE